MTPPAGRERLVTLTTDIGAAYAAQMKGVLLRTVDAGRVVDLVHDLSPHGIAEAAFVLRAIAPRFPSGTIHVVVVDPGVGGARAPLVLSCRDGSALVGPDNGVLWPAAQALGGGTGYRLDPAKVAAGPRVGTTFDGRDLFGPAAARLWRGTPASRLGAPLAPRRLRLPEPRRAARSAHGEVVHIDRFGNLISNVPSEWLPASAARVRVTLGGRVFASVPHVRSYAAVGRGRLGVLGSSFGTLEVAVSEGRADVRTRGRVGSSVALGWGPGGGRATRTVNSDRSRKG